VVILTVNPIQNTSSFINLFSRQHNIGKEAMPRSAVTAEIEKMFDAVIADPVSTNSCVSVNVDGSDLEMEHDRDRQYDDDDAETASLHSNSTDGGKLTTQS